MKEFKKQWRGYKKEEVNTYVLELENSIKTYQSEIESLKQQIEQLTQTNEHLQKQIDVHEKTNEEIARLALKEASDLIEKAKRNANMILKESMEYVRGLSKDMDTFKKEAIDFRKNVVKMSEEMLETIDKSEIFGLIREENINTKMETVHKKDL